MPPPPYGRDPPAEGPPPFTTTPSASRMATDGSLMAASARRNDDSWVEVASQPSSSSLSSIADEIVITGLRVGSSANGHGATHSSNAGHLHQPSAIPFPQRRRRLLQQVEAAAGVPTSPTSNPSNPSQPTTLPPPPRSSAGSSQEEYDETESEAEDRVMTNSADNTGATSTAVSYLEAQSRLQQRAAASDGDDEDEDDDDGTALGVRTSNTGSVRPTFRPQPNAFSHPPTHLQPHRSLSTPPHQHIAPLVPPYARRSSSSAAQTAPNRPPRHPAPNFMSPTYRDSYREDNDAALRASLTTLLSCAAAARGLPKKEPMSSSYRGDGPSTAAPSTSAGLLRPSNQPVGLRFVPESELGGGGDETLTRSQGQPSTRTKHTEHSSRNSAVSTASKGKRSNAGAGRSGGSGSSPRLTKKKRTSSSENNSSNNEGVAFLSPTLLTWVVSAGVVVLVSVVGFGAGFVMGREVGRQETGGGAMLGRSGGTVASMASGASGAASEIGSANATACGREIMRSSTGSTLRRFRWGAGMQSAAV